MTTVHHTPPPGATPFAIYEDPDDNEPPSPSVAYDEDMSFNSERSLPGEDEALPSIEPEDGQEDDFSDEPRPYRSSFTSRPRGLSAAHARRESGMTTTSFISSLPSEISISSKPATTANYTADPRYTPRKERPPFRNPSSVRAMQMSSPLPLAAYEIPRERTKGTYKLATPSRSGRSETPVSASGSRRHRRESLGHAHQSPHPIPTPQHLPLVLLHVTIIPMQFPYSPELMAKAMPEWLVENYKLLEEKLQDIVLMRRGLLISHPREEYDVLEERILESLELKTPRLLKCGHFIPPEDSDEPGEDEDDGASVSDDATGRGSRMSGGTLTVEEEGEWKYPTPEADDECDDCHRHVKKPGKGIGKGARRWDLKIYAANGLMRAGAWSAAWSEMERCDVEISPWIPEEVRKALDKKVIEQQEREKQKQLYEAEVLRRVEEETARLKKLEEEAEEKRRAEAAELLKRMEAARQQEDLEIQAAAEKKQFDDALNEMIEEAKESIRLEFETQALHEADSVAERFRALEEALKKEQERAAAPPPAPTPSLDTPSFDDRTRSVSRGRPRSHPRRQRKAEIPLSTLLTNYFLVLATDKRNLVIVVMGALVVYLSMHMNTASGLQLTSSSLPNIPDHHFPDSISSVVVTTTATAIETSISTVTVTQLQPSLESIRGPPASSSLDPLSAPSDTSTQSEEAITATSLDADARETMRASVSEGIEASPAHATEPTEFASESSVSLDEEKVSFSSVSEDLDAPTPLASMDNPQESVSSSPAPLSTSAATVPVSSESAAGLDDASPNPSDPALPIPESPEPVDALDSKRHARQAVSPAEHQEL